MIKVCDLGFYRKKVKTKDFSETIGLNIFIHVNESKHINKQYITMVYDGIQKLLKPVT